MESFNYKLKQVDKSLKTQGIIQLKKKNKLEATKNSFKVYEVPPRRIMCCIVVTTELEERARK